VPILRAAPDGRPGALGTVSPMEIAGELGLLEALRAGDERAFTELVERHAGSMLRLAMTFVRSRAVAEEVVQDAWLGVLRGIGSFEGRSSLKTWIFRILTNTAKTRAVREGRTVPIGSLGDEGEPAVDADRFLPPDHPRYPGHWASPPSGWHRIPEDRLLDAETLAVITRAIEALPAAQRQVVTLRDVEGWSSEETCEALGLSEVNQRVLLHRGRSKVRQALEEYLG
jgi:RNA polymerase sigma-70 factor, ECF subfamily